MVNNIKIMILFILKKGKLSYKNYKNKKKGREIKLPMSFKGLILIIYCLSKCPFAH